jgi:hypothetical protein
VDGTHVEANAALKSLRAELEVIDGGGEGTPSHGACADAPPADQRPRLELAAPRSGPTPKRTTGREQRAKRAAVMVQPPLFVPDMPNWIDQREVIDR